MPEDVVADRFHVLGCDISPAIEEGLPLGRPGEKDRGPRAGAVLDEGRNVQPVLAWLAGGVHDVDDVPLDLVIHVNLVDGVAQREEVLRSQHGRHAQVRIDGRHAIEDFQFLFLVRVRQLQLEHEAIDLGFR